MNASKQRKNLTTWLTRAQASPEYWTEAAVLVFTEEITQAMEREQMTRGELARRIGVSAAFVTKVLRGNVNLTLETVNKFALVFGMTARIHLAPKNQITRWIDVPSVADEIAKQPKTSRDRSHGIGKLLSTKEIQAHRRQKV